MWIGRIDVRNSRRFLFHWLRTRSSWIVVVAWSLVVFCALYRRLFRSSCFWSGTIVGHVLIVLSFLCRSKCERERAHV
jgi:hypothetical protein